MWDMARRARPNAVDVSIGVYCEMSAITPEWIARTRRNRRTLTTQEKAAIGRNGREAAIAEALSRKRQRAEDSEDDWEEDEMGVETSEAEEDEDEDEVEDDDAADEEEENDKDRAFVVDDSDDGEEEYVPPRGERRRRDDGRELVREDRRQRVRRA